MNANALVGMRVRIHSYIPADAFASLSAFSRISCILCVRIRIPDRILTPAFDTVINESISHFSPLLFLSIQRFYTPFNQG